MKLTNCWRWFVAGSVPIMAAMPAGAQSVPPPVTRPTAPSTSTSRTTPAPDASINTRDSFGLTPLHWAVQDGDAELASQLLRRGADPNLQDALGQTPLHLAAILGETEIARLILAQSRPDLNLRDEDGMTPLQWAAEGDHREIVRLILGQR